MNIYSASTPYLVQAFMQIAPTEDPEKDFSLEWRYDIHKVRVGSGYLSSSSFLGMFVFISKFYKYSLNHLK